MVVLNQRANTCLKFLHAFFISDASGCIVSTPTPSVEPITDGRINLLNSEIQLLSIIKSQVGSVYQRHCIECINCVLFFLKSFNQKYLCNFSYITPTIWICIVINFFICSFTGMHQGQYYIIHTNTLHTYTQQYVIHTHTQHTYTLLAYIHMHYVHIPEISYKNTLNYYYYCYFGGGGILRSCEML